jgi:hypothetical protein
LNIGWSMTHVGPAAAKRGIAASGASILRSGAAAETAHRPALRNDLPATPDILISTQGSHAIDG